MRKTNVTEENYFWTYKISFPKKLELFVIHRYSIKMCFFHTYTLEKYFTDKLTIYYFSSVHAHRYHANLGTLMSWSKMVGAK